ncbi:MAG: hypothetical protein SFZ03_00225 [Candidatus Melainabacteria bacterium]|nr:hypothetical protein [Candidatus Melainabacteria bacterium]
MRDFFAGWLSPTNPEVPLKHIGTQCAVFLAVALSCSVGIQSLPAFAQVTEPVLWLGEAPVPEAFSQDRVLPEAISSSNDAVSKPVSKKPLGKIKDRLFALRASAMTAAEKLMTASGAPVESLAEKPEAKPAKTNPEATNSAERASTESPVYRPLVPKLPEVSGVGTGGSTGGSIIELEPLPETALTQTAFGKTTELSEKAPSTQPETLKPASTLTPKQGLPPASVQPQPAQQSFSPAVSSKKVLETQTPETLQPLKPLSSPKPEATSEKENPLPPQTESSLSSPPSVPAASTTTREGKAPQTLTPEQVAAFDLLTSVEIPLEGYPEAAHLPKTLTDPSQTYEWIVNTTHNAVKMELIRRAARDFSAQQQVQLVEKLHQRHLAAKNDAQKSFDYGYAHAVLDRNKTALFFLRKANDRLNDAFASLAYGMAQAEMELHIEHENPHELTVRKLDVTYKLGDAVLLDVKQHQPGFWPTYVRVMDKLRVIPAYTGFTLRDQSAQYVPYGNRSAGYVYQQTPDKAAIDQATVRTAFAAESASPPALVQDVQANPANPLTACNATTGVPLTSPVDWLQHYLSRGYSAKTGDGVYTLHVFRTNTPKQDRVIVTDPRHRVVADVQGAGAPHIVEDLDADGTFELVFREFSTKPYAPLRVYRLNDCGYTQDPSLGKVFD